MLTSLFINDVSAWCEPSAGLIVASLVRHPALYHLALTRLATIKPDEAADRAEMSLMKSEVNI